jgi:hypothetical protein
MGHSFGKAKVIALFNSKVGQDLHATETVPCLSGSHELSVTASRDHLSWLTCVLEKLNLKDPLKKILTQVKNLGHQCPAQ